MRDRMKVKLIKFSLLLVCVQLVSIQVAIEILILLFSRIFPTTNSNTTNCINAIYYNYMIHVGSLHSTSIRSSIHPSIPAFSDPKHNLPVAKWPKRNGKSCV